MKNLLWLGSHNTQAMYVHTNQVTSYYMGNIGVSLQEVENIAKNREKAFHALEQQSNFLHKPVMIDHNDEAVISQGTASLFMA